MLDNVVVDRPVIVLERNQKGIGNWKSPNAPPRDGKPTQPRPPPVPFIGIMTLRDGALTYGKPRHQVFRIRVAKADLSAANDTSRVNIHADASYNDLPLAGTVVFESFDALRRVPRPVAAEAIISANSSSIKLTGTMTDPLNFDGAKGKLDLTAQTFHELSDLIGAPELKNTNLVLTGSLDRQGDQWRWTNLTGSFAGSPVVGSLGLDEGSPTVPDHFMIDLDFRVLDLQRLASGLSSDGGHTGILLHVQEKPAETYAIKIGMREAVYRHYKFSTVALEANIEPLKITLDKLSFGFVDGRVELSGSDQAAGEAGHVVLNATASQMNAAQFLKMVGLDTAVLTGKAGAALAMEVRGKTVNDLLTAGSGQLIVSMEGGQVSRHILELASTDARVLFHRLPDFASVNCLLGVATMRGGIASVTPLRLRTSEGNLFGGGLIDLRRDSVDLLVQSDRQSTSFWALDIPLLITGGLSSPKVLPLAGTGVPPVDYNGTENLRVLPPKLRQLIGGRC